MVVVNLWGCHNTCGGFVANPYGGVLCVLLCYGSKLKLMVPPREVLRLRGSISRDMPWEVATSLLSCLPLFPSRYISTLLSSSLLQVMPDLFFYRDPEDAEKEEAAREEAVAASKQVTFVSPPRLVPHPLVSPPHPLASSLLTPSPRPS